MGGGWEINDVDVRKDGWGAFDNGRRPGRDDERDGRDAFHKWSTPHGGDIVNVGTPQVEQFAIENRR